MKYKKVYNYEDCSSAYAAVECCNEHQLWNVVTMYPWMGNIRVIYYINSPVDER